MTKTSKIVMNGLMISMVFLATYFTKIPIPGSQGYFNIGDVVIMLSASFGGPLAGALAGSLGSALADVAAAYYIYAPVTFIVKGLEGLVAGILFRKFLKRLNPNAARSFSFIIAATVMISGYFISEYYILALFDKNFGLTAAVAGILTNIPQGGISVILAIITAPLLEKAKLFDKKDLRKI